jgi:tight adherence protein B
MSAAVLLAGFAGGFAVWGAWEVIAALEEAAPARVFGRVAAPLRAVAREGREPSTSERRRLAVVGAGTLFAVGWLLSGPFVGAALSAAGPWVATSLVRARRRRWRGELAEAAPTVARALADALAAGHSIRGAIEAVAAAGGLGAAAGAELNACAAALALGERTEAVLERLRARAGHPAFDTVVAALMLHGATGGRLASLLASLAGELEEARRVEGDARTATAQARFTAWLVAALPVGAVVLAELGRPGTLAEILSTPGTAWLGAAGLLFQIAALVAVSRMARVGEGR